MISNYLYFPVVHRKGELSQNLIPLMIFSFFPLCDSEAVCVIPKRFERLTHALEGRCSIQLSYGTDLVYGMKTGMRLIFVCKDSVFLSLCQRISVFFDARCQKNVVNSVVFRFFYDFTSSMSLFSEGMIISFLRSSM